MKNVADEVEPVRGGLRRIDEPTKELKFRTKTIEVDGSKHQFECPSAGRWAYVGGYDTVCVKSGSKWELKRNNGEARVEGKFDTLDKAMTAAVKHFL